MFCSLGIVPLFACCHVSLSELRLFQYLLLLSRSVVVDCIPMDCSIPDFPILRYLPKLQSLLKLLSIVSVIQSNHLTLCHPIVLLPSVFPSIGVFSIGSSHELAKELESFSFSIGPSDEYSGLISFRMDWFGLPAVQGTLKSLLQHHGSKASILQHSAFYIGCMITLFLSGVKLRFTLQVSGSPLFHPVSSVVLGHDSNSMVVLMRRMLRQTWLSAVVSAWLVVLIMGEGEKQLSCFLPSSLFFLNILLPKCSRM